jgi:aryl-alcohol dehydrogenase-like predicted oxidoreductase
VPTGSVAAITLREIDQAGSKLAAQYTIIDLALYHRREQGYTPAQVALAWVLDCAPYSVPIPGTRSIKRLKENALRVMVRLGDAQLERLYGILRERPVTGARYPASSRVTIDT